MNFYRYIGEHEKCEWGAVEAGFPSHSKEVLEQNVWDICVVFEQSGLLDKGRMVEEVLGGTHRYVI